MLLYRCARLEEDSCASGGAIGGGRIWRHRTRSHPRADRARYRSGFAGRNRGRDLRRGRRDPPERSETHAVKFGPTPVDEAVGTIAAHTVRAGDAVLKKGSQVKLEDV